MQNGDMVIFFCRSFRKKKDFENAVSGRWCLDSRLKLLFSWTVLVLQIYGVFYRDPEIGFKLFFFTDSCSQDLALQESE